MNVDRLLLLLRAETRSVDRIGSLYLCKSSVQLSAYYDIVHGEGLAILIPHWLRHMLREDNVWKYVEYGVNVWGIDPALPEMEIANRAIDATAAFFKAMNLPATLREVGIDESKFDVMAARAGAGLQKAFVPMTAEDVKEIYKKSL